MVQCAQEVLTVSLRVLERIDPRTINGAVRKGNGGGGLVQLPLLQQMILDAEAKLIDYETRRASG